MLGEVVHDPPAGRDRHQPPSEAVVERALGPPRVDATAEVEDGSSNRRRRDLLDDALVMVGELSDVMNGHSRDPWPLTAGYDDLEFATREPGEPEHRGSGAVRCACVRTRRERRGQDRGVPGPRCTGDQEYAGYQRQEPAAHDTVAKSSSAGPERRQLRARDHAVPSSSVDGDFVIE